MTNWKDSLFLRNIQEKKGGKKGRKERKRERRKGGEKKRGELRERQR